MIITSAPLRISFLGGGTDFPGWFQQHGGMVISTTIDQYVHIIISHLSPVWGTKYKFSYSAIENVRSIEEIKHPLIRTCIKEFSNKDDRLSILYASDLPGNSGLGSSSSFCAGMISGIKKLNQQPCLSKYELARESIRIERNILEEAGGWQDQVATSYGGFNKITFINKSFEVENLNDIFLSNYLKDCFLVHVGHLRKAHEISIDQRNIMLQKEKLYTEMTFLMEPALQAIEKNDYQEFSRLIDCSWELKKQYSQKITNSEVDDAVIKLKSLGGCGIKLLGAGSGGFLLCRFEDKNIAPKLKQLGFTYCLKVKGTKESITSKVLE